MKKIAYIINSVKKNGPTKVLLNMIKGINKEEYELYLITIIDENDPEIIRDLSMLNIKIIELNYLKGIGAIFKKDEINNIIKEEKIDIIHTHGHVPTFMLKSSKALKVSTVHNCLYEDFKCTYGKIKGFLINELYIFSLRKFDRVISCSQSSYNVVKKRISKCSFVRNGIDCVEVSKKDRISIRNNVRNDLNIPIESKVYIYVGVLNHNKNVMALLSFFKSNLKENEYLIILGEGILKEEVLKYKSNNIKVLGFKENVNDYLYASDIYVSFSLSEGFSISIIEALNCNLLLLLSSIPSHIECFFINNKYYLGEYFDDSNIKEKKNLVSSYKDIVRTSNFQENYLSAISMMKEYEKIYKELYQKEKI
ncbi:MAG: glycosyltransferase family 4 protein [Clostridium celatum]|nr:glycosyltransferase family 4 protein [Clostridium celatum]